jgi:CelD/BcsL family acetyltransferase involved in cellulose biosynthesis
LRGIQQGLIVFALRPMLTVEIVDDFSLLLRKKAEWSSFAETLPDLTPFQLPDWLLTWWRHFGSGQLLVFIFREREEIAAIVPCFRHEWAGRRQITLIGAGLSDYLEPGIARRHCPEVLRLLAEQLREDRCWDVCNWQDLGEGTPLRSLPSDGLRLAVETDVECTEIPIHDGFEQWCDQRPHGLRRNLRRYLEKARAIEEPHFCVSPEPKTSLVDALVALHTVRWREHGQPGMIAANDSARFLRDVVEEFASRDMLTFFSLHFQDRIVAIILSFRYRNALFSYLSAFDPNYSEFGFGRTLLYHSLRYTFEMRYRSWNFLRGSEPYKFDWGARGIPKCRVIVMRNARI